jgi:Ca-activated chloride channel family protein
LFIFFVEMIGVEKKQKIINLFPNISFATEYVPLLFSKDDTFPIVCTIDTSSMGDLVVDGYDVSIVLDISRSMQGVKIGNSKLAICELIDKLKSEDTVSLVVYDDESREVFSNQHPTTPGLKELVRDIEIGGTTNIGAGLIAGARSLGVMPHTNARYFIPANHPPKQRDKDKEESVDLPNTQHKIKRIFLFSDGSTNTGLRDSSELCGLAEEIYQAGVSISCFGLGDDYDEDLMTRVARCAGGEMTHIAKAHLIPQYVNQSIQSLSATIGVGASIHFIAKEPWVLGDDKLENVVSINDLRKNDKIPIVLGVKMGIEDWEPVDHTTVLEYTFSYTNLQEQSQMSCEGVCVVSFTTDQMVRREPNSEAQSMVLLREAGDLDKEVIQLIDDGNTERAIRIKEEVVNMLARADELHPGGMARAYLDADTKALQLLKDEDSGHSVRKAISYTQYSKENFSIHSSQKMLSYANESE